MGAFTKQDIDKLEKYYNDLDDNYKNSEIGKILNTTVSKYKADLETANAEDEDWSLGKVLKGTFKDIFTPKTLAAGIGNLAGGLLNYGLNKSLQNNQLKNQEELQDRAATLNAESTRQQAVLQTEGMKNAGLNPAQVTGTGAASLQAGAAAGASTNLGNIFSGLADLIQAAKAPSEIEEITARAALENRQSLKTDAETENIESQTDLNKQQYNVLNPLVAEQIKESTKLVKEQVTNANNLNETWKAQVDFLNRTFKGQIQNTIEQWKKNGIWEDIGPALREQFESIANYDGVIGPGEIDAITKMIQTNTALSNEQKTTAENAFQTAKLYAQMNDPEIWKEIVNMDATQARLLKNEINELWTRSKVNKTAANLNAQNKEKALVEQRDQAYRTEHDQKLDPVYQKDHGTPEGTSRAKKIKAVEWFMGLSEKAVGVLEFVGASKLAGGAKGTVQTITGPKGTQTIITRPETVKNIKKSFR